MEVHISFPVFDDVTTNAIWVKCKEAGIDLHTDTTYPDWLRAIEDKFYVKCKQVEEELRLEIIEHLKTSGLLPKEV